MTTNPSDQLMTNIYNSLTNVLLEETAKEFKKWMANSDAPKSVKARFDVATDLVEDDELGCIVLSVNWIEEGKKAKAARNESLS